MLGDGRLTSNNNKRALSGDLETLMCFFSLLYPRTPPKKKNNNMEPKNPRLPNTC